MCLFTVTADWSCVGTVTNQGPDQPPLQSCVGRWGEPWSHLFTSACFLALSSGAKQCIAPVQSQGSQHYEHTQKQLCTSLGKSPAHSLTKQASVFQGSDSCELCGLDGWEWETELGRKKQLILCNYGFYTLGFNKPQLKNAWGFFFQILGTKKMALWLRVLATLSWDLSSAPSTHMVTINCL